MMSYLHNITTEFLLRQTQQTSAARSPNIAQPENPLPFDRHSQNRGMIVESCSSRPEVRISEQNFELQFMKGKPISGLQNFPRDIGHITIQNAMEFPDRSLIAALPVPANTGIINRLYPVQKTTDRYALAVPGDEIDEVPDMILMRMREKPAGNTDISIGSPGGKETVKPLFLAIGKIAAVDEKKLSVAHLDDIRHSAVDVPVIQLQLKQSGFLLATDCLISIANGIRRGRIGKNHFCSLTD